MDHNAKMKMRISSELLSFFTYTPRASAALSKDQECPFARFQVPDLMMPTKKKQKKRR
jgi:hypothetical protein